MLTFTINVPGSKTDIHKDKIPYDIYPSNQESQIAPKPLSASAVHMRMAITVVVINCDNPTP